MIFLKSYLFALVIFLGLDFIWLEKAAKSIYHAQLSFILKDKFNLTAAVIFYLIFISGLVFFVINPALNKSSWHYALLAGLFYGLITYATYDLTNLSTLKNWPILITVIDISWGSILCALTSFLTYHFTKYFT
ncbi:DUF2177 family protein [Halanaerobium salsuginis]|jgi:uncharacterized membrane protein|uniref:Uncharacterized membrane protein n=1 Tax=Halanaerobium salsuginis TaxID=29563 RepID=A0A1I4LME8_9FIRM|nr:DUF2177 family protein [Halanaerobium salsuginis]SFL92172.1 Uncharacterized membrane protein [Halanaerobium salsuginis]